MDKECRDLTDERLSPLNNYTNLIKGLKNNGMIRIEYKHERLAPGVSSLVEKYVAEVVNARDDFFVEAVIREAKAAGGTCLDLIDKDFIVSAIKREQERRKNDNKFLENMKNVLEIEKRNAVKEFAEKLKTKAFDKDMFNDWAGATYVVLVREIDKLLKEYEQ